MFVRLVNLQVSFSLRPVFALITFKLLNIDSMFVRHVQCQIVLLLGDKFTHRAMKDLQVNLMGVLRVRLEVTKFLAGESAFWARETFDFDTARRTFFHRHICPSRLKLLHRGVNFPVFP